MECRPIGDRRLPVVAWSTRLRDREDLRGDEVVGRDLKVALVVAHEANAESVGEDALDAGVSVRALRRERDAVVSGELPPVRRNADLDEFAFEIGREVRRR